MDLKKHLNNLVKNIKIDLMDEFDRNFERKAFFDKPWPKVKKEPGIGSLMMRTGDLRNSIKARIQGMTIVFSSSEPYASTHNEGEDVKIPVTPQMKRWAWAMYMKSKNQFYKNFALTKKSEINVKMPERRFIGEHPQVDAAVKKQVDHTMTVIDEEVKKQFRNMGFR